MKVQKCDVVRKAMLCNTSPGKVYKGQKGVAARKFNDLMILKAKVIPRPYRHFYDNLKITVEESERVSD